MDFDRVCKYICSDYNDIPIYMRYEHDDIVSVFQCAINLHDDIEKAIQILCIKSLYEYFYCYTNKKIILSSTISMLLPKLMSMHSENFFDIACLICNKIFYDNSVLSVRIGDTGIHNVYVDSEDYETLKLNDDKNLCRYIFALNCGQFIVHEVFNNIGDINLYYMLYFHLLRHHEYKITSPYPKSCIPTISLMEEKGFIFRRTSHFILNIVKTGYKYEIIMRSIGIFQLNLLKVRMRYTEVQHYDYVGEYREMLFMMIKSQKDVDILRNHGIILFNQEYDELFFQSISIFRINILVAFILNILKIFMMRLVLIIIIDI
jgi:hypothetical protein